MKLRFKLLTNKLKLLLIPIIFLLIFIFYPIKTNKDNIHFQTSFMRSVSRLTSPFSKWVSIKDLSPELICAVLKSEDKRFFRHLGFDFNAIYLGLKSYVLNKKLVAGSTITQQLAKNLYGTESRSIYSKIYEAFQSIRLEAQLSKYEILELYINTIELGEELWGIENASWYYFDHGAKKLNLPEALLISSIIASPRTFFRQEQHKRVRNIYSRINYQLYISEIIKLKDYNSNNNIWSKLHPQLVHYKNKFDLAMLMKDDNSITLESIETNGCGVDFEERYYSQ